LGGALSLQIRLQDIDVILGLLETLAVDSLDALQPLAAVKTGSGL
jgi:hypothetical protein